MDNHVDENGNVFVTPEGKPVSFRWLSMKAIRRMQVRNAELAKAKATRRARNRVAGRQRRINRVRG